MSLVGVIQHCRKMHSQSCTAQYYFQGSVGNWSFFILLHPRLYFSSDGDPRVLLTPLTRPPFQHKSLGWWLSVLSLAGP